MRRTHTYVPRALLGLLAGAVLSLGSAQLSADTSCRKVRGAFNIIPVSGAACPSPVGVCGEGTFSGGLKGDYFSVFLSATPTADTPTTEVLLFTAETTIAAAKSGRREGELVFKEAGAFHTTGAGEFAELYSVVSGTGDFVGASGVLKSTGTFTAAAGGEGVYQGEICVP